MFRLLQCLLILFSLALPVAANTIPKSMSDEKRTRVVMRMVGHEVLKCLGDMDSRVLPIETIGEQYRIAFESELSFDPAEIASTIEGVLTRAGASGYYLVEIEQCATKEIVHSFQIGNPAIIPCEGRILPKDCYRLLITKWDDIAAGQNTVSENVTGLFFSQSEHGTGFLTVAVFVVSFLLLGGIAYLFRKKAGRKTDPDLIHIGASRFDKKTMALSFAEQRVDLSNKEAELLALLHDFANQPIERELILREVWGDEGDYVGRTLDVFISRLRKKLEADDSLKIVNIRGVGYKLVVNQ